MNREQREAVRMGKVDFVVTRDKTLSTYNYRLISKEKFYLEGKVRVYYLYELIPPNERHSPAAACARADIRKTLREEPDFIASVNFLRSTR